MSPHGGDRMEEERRHINPSLVLVQPRKTCPDVNERLLTGTNCSKSNKTKLLSSTDNLCKQFGPRSGLWSGSKLFDTLIVFPKEFLKKLFGKNVDRGQQKQGKENTACQGLIGAH